MMICLRKYKLISSLLVFLVFISGCASKNPESKVVSKRSPEAGIKFKAQQKPFSYIKVERTNGTVFELHVASRKLVPIRGKKPEIWLVAVTHIGESNYYSELQQHLDGMTLVLFEGIRMNSFKRNKTDESSKPGLNKEGSSMMDKQSTSPNEAKIPKGVENTIQAKLARSLGLAFQLEAIDYARSNFDNCDMNIEQLETIFSGRNSSTGSKGKEPNQEWENLKGLYLGDSLTSMIADLVLRIIGSSPRMGALMKIVFIETLSKIEGDFGEWEGMPESMKELLKVLIQERNHIIVKRLKEVLPRMKKGGRIALFYGAAHMYDLESRICAEFGYKPVEERWFKAFSVDGKKYGITEFEINFMRRIVESTIREMKVKN